MGEVLTREAWNSLIQQYNDLVEAIPEDCNPPEPLELVDPAHIWRKSDVTEFQDRLRQLCACNDQLLTFADVPRLWQTRTIQDIEFAIFIGACIQGDPDPVEIDLGSFGPCLSKQCGSEEPTTECVGSGASMPVDLTSFLASNSQEPVKSDSITRTWKIVENRSASPICDPFVSDGVIENHTLFSGVVKCTGELEPPDPVGESPGPGDISNFFIGEVLVACFPDCDDSCNTTYNQVRACVASRQPRQLKLVITCDDCKTCEELGYDEHNANPGGGGIG